jgi:serine/threonine protein phosphatase PrpC
MQNDAANLYCPKPTCQTLNRETHRFCQKCRTPLPRHYLWVIGKERAAGQPGQLIANRYLRKSDQIVLDTKPGLLPALPEEVPPEITPYLKLFPHRLHLPHVYGYIPREESRSNTTLWLLEAAPIDLGVETNSATPAPIQLQPALATVWPQASALRQLNWLWQIANLWQPFQAETVASSLVNLELLRVEGPLVRLLQLQMDSAPVPLSQLGQVWLQWAKQAQPLIQPFLEKLAQQLIAGQIQKAEQLVTVLDKALSRCGSTQTRVYEVATRTDTGPSRRRNEDACYPISGTHQTEESEPLVIVCDGIGGHEGGNVASASAIAAIRQRMGQVRSQTAMIDPLTLTVELEKAVCVANDVISERNNDEQRQGRQRMGTTLVMALAHAHELYISHVGDSRAYWITKAGCYQVTLDDDVASREVRLGYALYRDAVQQPAAGSLVQALGMGGSGMLHPTAQRFVIDDESVFVLCSDGLSDNDRVEQYWETEILPILTGESTVMKTVLRLVELANTQNGHDNVTVGLIHCRLQENHQVQVSPNELLAVLNTRATGTTQILKAGTPKVDTTSDSTTGIGTQLVQPPRESSSPLMWLLLILGLLALPGMAYWLIPEVRKTVNPLLGVNPSPSRLSPTQTASQPTVAPSPAAVQSFAPGELIRIQNAPLEVAHQNHTLTVQLNPTGQPATSWTVPAGSILQVLPKSSQQEDLQPLKVCWIPDTTNVAGPTAQYSTPAPTPISNIPPREAASKPPAQTQSSEPTPLSVESGTIVWLPEASDALVALPILNQGSVDLGTCQETDPSEVTPSEQFTPVAEPTLAPSAGQTATPPSPNRTPVTTRPQN